MSMSQAQSRALVILPKITATFSMLCSGLIIYDVTRSGAAKNSTRKRLIMGMSLYDVVVSFLGYIVGGFFAPVDSGAWLASGSQRTCNVNGFFANLNVAVAWTNMSLSFYYLLKIRYGVKDRVMTRTYEPILHLIPLMVGVGCSLAALLLEQYTMMWFNCWIGPEPYGCKNSWANNGVTTCDRGDNSTYHRWILYYVPIWFTLLVTSGNMFLVYLSVYQQEKKMNQYNFSYQREKMRLSQAYHSIESLNVVEEVGAIEEETREDTSPIKRCPSIIRATSEARAARKKLERDNFVYSRQVAVQGYWYCGAFLLTWIPPSITTIMHGAKKDPPYWFILITMSWIPAQGIFNSMVYFHRSFSKITKRNNSSTRTTAPRFASSLDMPNTNSGEASAEVDVSTSKRVQDLQSPIHEVEDESKEVERPNENAEATA